MRSPSTISATTVVRGNVGGDGSLEILGRVEGNVTMTGQVIVAADAVVRGNVSATEIQVAGSIAGNLTASDILMLNTGARVVGDLAGSRIGVAEGALVRGLVRTEGEPALAKPTPVAAARTAAPVVKPAMAARPAFQAPAARTASAVMPRSAMPAPAAMPPKVHVPPVQEKPVVLEPEPDDEPPSSEPEPLAPSGLEVANHEHSSDGPPPMVVPALKGQIKAKKKFKNR
jgi:cytoskeletal protein CcmA (bactofilin family)